MILIYSFKVKIGKKIQIIPDKIKYKQSVQEFNNALSQLKNTIKNIFNEDKFMNKYPPVL